MIVGCYLIMNLFIAILLNAFADGGEEEGGKEGGKDEGGKEGGKEEGGKEVGKSGDSIEDGGKTAEPADPSVDPALLDAPWPANHSLCLFRPSHPVRVFSRQLISDPRFDQFIIVCIVASSGDRYTPLHTVTW